MKDEKYFSPRLVRFLNSAIPWEPKIRTIRGPPVVQESVQNILIWIVT